MASKIRLGVSDAAYLRPLLAGLNAAGAPFELLSELPAVNSVHLNERTNGLRCAFLSPVDYARYGGSYRIIPGVCVSSSSPTRTITLTIKNGVRNIRKVAVDIRVTSEIILAKIILLERIRNLPDDRSEIEFVPTMPALDVMLQKADAALVVNLAPQKETRSQHYTLDLVEEWNDMTGFPYVHGFWVAREEDIEPDQIKALTDAKNRGVAAIDSIVRDYSAQSQLAPEEVKAYFESFSYDLGQSEIDSLTEFVTLAYYHGVLGDVPEIRFFDLSPSK